MRILSIYNYSVDAITPHLKSEDKVNNQLFNHGEQYDFLSPNERAAILERYTVGNQWIAREFLGRRNGILFQEALPDTSKPWKKFRLEKEEVIKLFADADFLEEKQRAIFQEQVLYALAHPVMINLKLFQGKIRRTIKKTGQEYTTYI